MEKKVETPTKGDVLALPNRKLVKPIMFYGVFILNGVFKKATLAKKLEHVQRAIHIRISDALRTTPTIAVNVIWT